MLNNRSRLMRPALSLFILMAFSARANAQDYALSLYAGQMTKEKWQDAILPGADFADATIMVAAVSWTFGRYFDDKLSGEMEVQVGRYFGAQDHWEFNLPIVGLRWHRFPWDDHLATSFAWGIGPSYATKLPPIEQEVNGTTKRWLVYWYAELTFGPPKKSWEVLMRLHHRSDAFGLVADEGGSNTVCLGVRHRF